jgi:hypothetical protein
MDNSGFDFMLAMAVIVVPLALAALLVEFQSRQKSLPKREQRHTRVQIAKTDSA